MAAVTTMKCSSRRTALRRVQLLVTEMINANEEADRVRQQLIAAGYSSSEVANTVNKVLAMCGPTNVTTEATNDTVVDRLINMLSANTASIEGQIGWSYEAEA